MQAEEKNPGREGLKEDKDDRQAGGGRQAKNPKVLAFAVPFLLGYRGTEEPTTVVFGGLKNNAKW